MSCDWCAINAGRTHATRPCCVLRRLAQAPRQAQIDYAATLTQAARDELRPKLADEKLRLKQLRKTNVK